MGRRSKLDNSASRNFDNDSGDDLWTRRAIEGQLAKSSAGQVLPKSGWETDEAIEEAACREAREEAGIECTVFKTLRLDLSGQSH